MKEHSAVLIIDVQAGMFTSSIISPVHKGDEILARIGSLISKARAAQLPVFYIRHNGGKGHPLEARTNGWHIHPTIAPADGDVVVDKLTPDSFKNTFLDDELQSRKVKKLIVTGIQTEYCVDTTCRRAFSLGYEVVLISDAHSTWNTDVLSADQIIAHHNKTLGGTFATLQTEAETQFVQ
jgi:nicotinamidase-related amidase